MGKQLDFHSQAIIEKVGKDNQWIVLREKINWWRFKDIIRVIDRTGDKGGRPRYDIDMMFRAVLLAQWHDMSDYELEQSLKTRLDFMCFCGLSLSDEVPDQNTIQAFRASLIKYGLLPKALKLLNKELENLGLKLNKKGTFILDATIVEAHARPLTSIEPDQDGESGTKTFSKDPDARWVKTGANKAKFGYKQHTLVDAESGFIEELDVTPANVHEVTTVEKIVNDKQIDELLADKGYASKSNREFLKSKSIKDGIMFKAQKNSELTQEQKDKNKQISKLRYKVEAVFGTQKERFGFHYTRYFTTARVQAQAILKAICCNLLKACRMIVFRKNHLAQA